MKYVFEIHLTIFLVTCICFCQTVDDDENRPYEFGFTIENYQHRHEKKDVNGIIQGEFGFITADGIYHVTVYATDENGDFHILSMKNIRVSPPLDQIDGKSKPPTKQQLYSSEKSASKYTTPRTIAQFTTQPTIKPACAGCGYVTTPKLPKQQQNTFSFQTPAFQDKNPQKAQYQNLNNLNNGLLPPKQNSYINKHSDNLVSEKNNNQDKNEQFSSIEKGNDQSSLITGNQPPTTLSDRQNNNPLSRVSVSNNRIQVPGNPDIPIVDKYPNMKEGLPPGIEEKDIKDLLYKFNYTVGFHGHYERGYKSGAKIGGYFVNGRDGISRIVTYVADENGFRPKVRFVNLGLDSPLTPHEDTEKNFGLKSFEFIWYPIE